MIGIRIGLPRLSAQRIKRVQQKDAFDLKRMLDQGSGGQKNDSPQTFSRNAPSSKHYAGNSTPTRKTTLRQLVAKLKNIFS